MVIVFIHPWEVLRQICNCSCFQWINLSCCGLFLNRVHHLGSCRKKLRTTKKLQPERLRMRQQRRNTIKRTPRLNSVPTVGAPIDWAKACKWSCFHLYVTSQLTDTDLYEIRMMMMSLRCLRKLPSLRSRMKQKMMRY